MKVHLTKSPADRNAQLKILGMGMEAWEKELRKANKMNAVSLHYYDEDTVEIFPIIGNVWTVPSAQQELSENENESSSDFFMSISDNSMQGLPG